MFAHSVCFVWNVVLISGPFSWSKKSFTESFANIGCCISISIQVSVTFPTKSQAVNLVSIYMTLISSPCFSTFHVLIRRTNFILILEKNKQIHHFFLSYRNTQISFVFLHYNNIQQLLECTWSTVYERKKKLTRMKVTNIKINTCFVVPYSSMRTYWIFTIDDRDLLKLSMTCWFPFQSPFFFCHFVKPLLEQISILLPKTTKFSLLLSILNNFTISFAFFFFFSKKQAK